VTLLTEQLNLNYGLSLANNKAHAALGPAGCGKTETAKDFGKKLGRWVSVTSCSDQLNNSELMKIVKGINADNTWVCFDEFNRVLHEKIPTFMKDLSEFMASRAGKENGVFITMNPGYAGRSYVELDPKHWNSN
jgi:midasin (ATPase involved in ribosome maturation)